MVVVRDVGQFRLWELALVVVVVVPVCCVVMLVVVVLLFRRLWLWVVCRL